MTTPTRTVTAPELANVADWFKSSYSDNGNNCVEVADLTRSVHAAVAVRDSKDPEGPALLLAPQAFAAFVADVRGGRFEG
ncbi:DUF397 domain-containing protein [Streptomyces sp. CA-111067]|uniref:DUF397 domain-containing protein n=1 Tax=Streptomyces sp. CA-111067 TaxID=3240046 RepID=UPI003D9556FE